jgi:hypothetical protein
LIRQEIACADRGGASSRKAKAGASEGVRMHLSILATIPSPSPAASFPSPSPDDPAISIHMIFHVRTLMIRISIRRF